MAGRDCRLPLRQALLGLALLASSFCGYHPLTVTAQQQKCKASTPVMFNFGDSNSDTGGVTAALGYVYGAPEGRAFFHPPTGRLGDGRLIIDFLCETLGTSYLRPYLDAVGLSSTNFSNGANFAISGSSVLPPTSPFNLAIQVRQFLRFRSLSLSLASTRQGQLVDPPGFDNALYTLDIGQNDLTAAFSSNTPYDQIVATKIPAVLDEIKNNVLSLYNNGGARKFWVHATGPLGCLPEKLASLPRKGTPGELDPVGCLAAPNDAARAFNAGLAKLCDQLRAQLTDATVVYVDVFSIKYDVIANATSYGFDAPPLMACCGNGGPPFNYNKNVQCLGKGYQVCAEGTKYISWDGVHYSEAANSIVASKIITGNYSNPPLGINDFCNG